MQHTIQLSGRRKCFDHLIVIFTNMELTNLSGQGATHAVFVARITVHTNIPSMSNAGDFATEKFAVVFTQMPSPSEGAPCIHINLCSCSKTLKPLQD